MDNNYTKRLLFVFFITISFYRLNAQCPVPTVIAGGPTTFCAGGSVTLTSSMISGSLTYLWSNGATTSSINVTTSGTYDVTVTDTNSCVTTSAGVVVTVNLNPTVNAGSALAAICPGTSTPALGGSFGGGATSAKWSDGGAGGTFTNNGGLTPGAAKYKASATATGTIILKLKTSGGSCGSVSATKSLTINPGKPSLPTITGPNTTCISSSNVVYSTAVVSGVTTYTWSVPTGISIISGQGTNTLTVLFTSNFTSGNIGLISSNSCGSSPQASLAITRLSTSAPATPGVISGPVNVCTYIANATNATYSIAAITNAVSYDWIVPAGCTIVSGQNTTSIVVSYSNSFLPSYINVKAVSGCGISSGLRSLLVNISPPATPGTITPSVSNICPLVGTSTNVTYTIAAVTGAASYSWSVPSGATLVSGGGTTSITVNYTSSFVSGGISVASVNACGVASPLRTLAITGSAPATPGTITPSVSNICPLVGTSTNVTYTIAAVTGAVSYNWSVPSGATLVSGGGTTSITVNYTSNFLSGSISVKSVSACGTISTARSYTVIKSAPPAPGTITPSTVDVCPLIGTSTNVTYSIAAVVGAVSYNWSVPSGATIISGNSTTSIVVNYTSSFVSGNVSVKSVSACGTISSAKSYTIIKSAPTTPGIITPSVVNVCDLIGTSTNVTYSIVAVNGAASYEWTIPSNGTIVSGGSSTSIVVNYTSSFVSGLVTVKSVSVCGTKSVARSYTVQGCSTKSIKNVHQVQSTNKFDSMSNIYPNPTSNSFIVNVNSEQEKVMIVEIFDALGEKIVEEKHIIESGENEIVTNVYDLKNGIYFVRFTDNNNSRITKTFIKQ